MLALRDKVILVPQEGIRTFGDGAFILPETAEQPSQIGTVVAVGSGIIVGDEIVPLEVLPGDLVLFSKYGGTEFEKDGVTYTVIRESEILVILESAEFDDEDNEGDESVDKKKEEPVILVDLK